MLLKIPFLVLIPTICYLGAVQGFISGAIPPLIIDKSQKFLLFAFYGFVTVCAAIISGKLSDYFGRRLLFFVIGALAHLIIFGLLLVRWNPPFDPNRWDMFIIMMICFSMGDSIFNTQIYAVISMLYGEKHPTDAFACMKLFQAGSIGIAFVEQVYFPLSVQILILICLLAFSLVTLIYENYGIVSLDSGKSIMSIREEKTKQTETKTEVEIPLTTLTQDLPNK